MCSMANTAHWNPIYRLSLGRRITMESQDGHPAFPPLLQRSNRPEAVGGPRLFFERCNLPSFLLYSFGGRSYAET
jgi:hypothetical protein